MAASEKKCGLAKQTTGPRVHWNSLLNPRLARMSLFCPGRHRIRDGYSEPGLILENPVGYTYAA
jgi:hypothetical protein